ncbi:SAM-dependent methyltransferase [Streptomyces sp. NPDC020192]|uniref:SAM-dependent methyltransferase n=1 Tax=Streptomyces sp. NPDC020192 TaxID=3365066 RepID=UPI0037A776F5
MRSTPQGRTTYIEADVNQPESLLNAPELVEVLGPGRPVTLSRTGSSTACSMP